MKISNQILNYFVFPSIAGEMPRVFLSPVTMNASVGKLLISKHLQNKEKISNGKILHVCFDMDSKRIYIPNANEFTADAMKPLFQAAQIKILKEFGTISNEKPIEGSPFSLLRIRKVSSFGYSHKAIIDHFGSDKFNDITVIEANLARMPKTAKQLPCLYQNNKNFVGGYVDNSEITFYDEIDIRGKARSYPKLILEQKSPFILIDISPIVNPSATEKEWAVLSGYRDYLYSNDELCNKDDLSSFSDLYAAKRHLYLGWPLEEVCKIFLERVNDFGELINGIQRIMAAAFSLENEGYKNPASFPFYFSFKIDPNKFPLNLSSVMKDGQPIADKQIGVFKIVSFDQSSGYIIIESPAFIEQALCLKILKAKSRPFICKYNPAMNTIDVKSQAGVYKELTAFNNEIPEKIKELIINSLPSENKCPPFRTDERARGISLSNPSICTLRKISEYYYACDHIKRMCKDRGEEFVDVDVIIGPLERIFGRGVRGGFMGQKQFTSSKLKVPHQIVKDVWVSPPVMAVDSQSMPSYAKQTETLIHEYSHNLFNKKNPDYENLYHKDPSLKNKDELQYWYLYLTDEDERLAHKEEIKYSLMSGTSVDEIVRDKIGGVINEKNMDKNYPIALKFKELVEEAISEM